MTPGSAARSPNSSCATAARDAYRSRLVGLIAFGDELLLAGGRVAQGDRPRALRHADDPRRPGLLAGDLPVAGEADDA